MSSSKSTALSASTTSRAGRPSRRWKSSGAESGGRGQAKRSEAGWGCCATQREQAPSPQGVWPAKLDHYRLHHLTAETTRCTPNSNYAPPLLGWPTAFTPGVMRVDQDNQPLPRHHPIHINQEQLLEGLLALACILGVSAPQKSWPQRILGTSERYLLWPPSSLYLRISDLVGRNSWKPTNVPRLLAVRWCERRPFESP